MNSRLDLHNKLVELLGSANCYYQPPETLKMTYPCIVYSKEYLDTTKADDTMYLKRPRYQLIVIDKKPDNQVIDKLLSLPMCRYDRHYVSDNMHHDSLTIYL